MLDRREDDRVARSDIGRRPLPGRPAVFPAVSPAVPPAGYFVAATVTPSQSAGGGSRRKVSARPA
jgi:hypothetical protein